MSRLPSRLLLTPLIALGSLRRLFGKRGYPENPKRILVAHHLLLGDTLMLAALLAKLRHNHPDAEIVMSCPRAIAPLFAANPWGVKALPYDPRKAGTLLRLALRRGFQLALVPGDSRHSLLARALGTRHVVAQAGDKPKYKNWFVNEQRAWPETATALPEIFSALALGKEPPPYSPEQWPLAPCRDFDRPAGRYAVLHLGASSKLKLWPADRWHALAEILKADGITPVWSGGHNESALVKAADPEGRHRSYAGQLDLLQLAHLLAGACLLVSPDTGVAHLGRITGTPTLTLFGPGSDVLCAQSKFFANMPASSLATPIPCRNQRILFRRTLKWVRRCGRGFDDSKRTPNDPLAPKCGNALCMAAISLESVLLACDQLLQSPASSGTRTP
ncbi:MAG: glycosyltransferase family 9 protein [Rhodocyclaceae bacterium]